MKQKEIKFLMPFKEFQELERSKKLQSANPANIDLDMIIENRVDFCKEEVDDTKHNNLFIVISPNSSLNFDESVEIPNNWKFCLGKKILSFKQKQKGPVKFQNLLFTFAVNGSKEEIENEEDLDPIFKDPENSPGMLSLVIGNIEDNMVTSDII